jgi:hypothetical protein
VIAYASWTGTKRNLRALDAAGWRLLMSAKGHHLAAEPGFKYALDNGAWTAYQQGHPFDVAAFERALRQLGGGADWSVLPDIVAGGAESLEMSLKWMRRVLDESPRCLIAVQDGMQPEDVRPFLGARVGIFVGGSTAWKLATMAGWCALADLVGCWCHVARVNSVKRISACSVAGATSFDGTSATRYSKTLPLLDKARRQTAFKGVA